jgi:DNA-binding MarR family transcriptional regulator
MDREFTKEERKALARLYESGPATFSGDYIPLSLKSLAMFMGKSESVAAGIMAGLETDGLVKKFVKAETEFYVLTDKGVEEFEYAFA